MGGEEFPKVAAAKARLRKARRAKPEPIHEARRKLLIAAVDCLRDELGELPHQEVAEVLLTGEESPWVKLDKAAINLVTELQILAAGQKEFREHDH